MDQDLLKHVDQLFHFIEKNAEDRFAFIQDNIVLIRKQQEESKEERKQINDKLYQIMSRETDRCKDCTTTKQVLGLTEKIQKDKKELDDDLVDYRYKKRNPKVVIQSLAVSVILVMASLFVVYLMIHQYVTQELNEAKQEVQKKVNIQKEAIYQEEIKSINK